MAAGVVERPQRTALIAQQQHRLGADREGAIGAGGCDAFGPAQIDPVAVPDSIELEGIVGWIEVPAARQRRLELPEPGELLRPRVRILRWVVRPRSGRGHLLCVLAVLPDGLSEAVPVAL
jgi:hypothetical protein